MALLASSLKHHWDGWRFLMLQSVRRTFKGQGAGAAIRWACFYTLIALFCSTMQCGALTVTATEKPERKAPTKPFYLRNAAADNVVTAALPENDTYASIKHVLSQLQRGNPVLTFFGWGQESQQSYPKADTNGTAVLSSEETDFSASVGKSGRQSTSEAITGSDGLTSQTGDLGEEGMHDEMIQGKDVSRLLTGKVKHTNATVATSGLPDKNREAMATVISVDGGISVGHQKKRQALRSEKSLSPNVNTSEASKIKGNALNMPEGEANAEIISQATPRALQGDEQLFHNEKTRERRSVASAGDRPELPASGDQQSRPAAWGIGEGIPHVSVEEASDLTVTKGKSAIHKETQQQEDVLMEGGANVKVAGHLQAQQLLEGRVKGADSAHGGIGTQLIETPLHIENSPEGAAGEAKLGGLYKMEEGETSRRLTSNDYEAVRDMLSQVVRHADDGTPGGQLFGAEGRFHDRDRDLGGNLFENNMLASGRVYTERGREYQLPSLNKSSGNHPSFEDHDGEDEIEDGVDDDENVNDDDYDKDIYYNADDDADFYYDADEDDAEDDDDGDHDDNDGRAAEQKNLAGGPMKDESWAHQSSDLFTPSPTFFDALSDFPPSVKDDSQNTFYDIPSMPDPMPSLGYLVDKLVFDIKQSPESDLHYPLERSPLSNLMKDNPDTRVPNNRKEATRKYTLFDKPLSAGEDRTGYQFVDSDVRPHETPGVDRDMQDDLPEDDFLAAGFVPTEKEWKYLPPGSNISSWNLPSFGDDDDDDDVVDDDDEDKYEDTEVDFDDYDDDDGGRVAKQGNTADGPIDNQSWAHQPSGSLAPSPEFPMTFDNLSFGEQDFESSNKLYDAPSMPDPMISLVNAKYLGNK